MKATLINNKGLEERLESLEELKAFLELPTDYWQSGTGDSAIKLESTDNEVIIFFKSNGKIFIIQNPDYLVPYLNKDRNIKTNTLTHYIGGEEFVFPESALLDVSLAFEILSNYIIKKELDSSFGWIDMYEINFEHNF